MIFSSRKVLVLFYQKFRRQKDIVISLSSYVPSVKFYQHFQGYGQSRQSRGSVKKIWDIEGNSPDLLSLHWPCTLHLSQIFKTLLSWGAWETQSVKCPTREFGSSHELSL